MPTMAISYYRTRDNQTVRTGDKVLDVFTFQSGTITRDLGDGWFTITTADGTEIETHAGNVCSAFWAAYRYPQYA